MTQRRDRRAVKDDAARLAPEAESPSLSEALTALQAHSQHALAARNGRELTLFEAQPDRIGRMVDLLIAGNYRDTAATIAGITSRSLRLWMERAEAGESRYTAVAAVVRLAEALAEASAVRNVRGAARDPRFWTADMTYLERKYPERWGRRSDDTGVPKVIVQIGARDSDVQVRVQNSEDGEGTSRLLGAETIQVASTVRE